MKTNVISVKNTGSGINAALAEAERFAEYQHLDRKEALRVRLLAEEMMGLIKGIVGEFYGEFWVEGEGKDVSLCLEADCKVDYDQREQFLSVSSSGKNEALRGFMGKLTGIFEYCLMSYDASIQYCGDYSDYMYDNVPSFGYERMWSLAAMRENLGTVPDSEDAREKWDELEKSIVASLADEVLVGVKSHKVRLIIKKSFA